MTQDEKKALEIGKKWYFDTMNPNEAAYRASIQMAKWKEQQMIEKVCEWMKDNANDYLEWYDWEECRLDTDKLLYDFKKAMEE